MNFDTFALLIFWLPLSQETVKEELIKYGIYFDDDYNYLQHLRDVNKTNVEWVEVPKNSKVYFSTLLPIFHNIVIVPVDCYKSRV